MKTHNFVIGPTDTDSISFCKPGGVAFTPEELKALLTQINELSPEFIEWEDDGYYKSCIALKAKNYVLYDGVKKTVKGSAFKTSSKEPALKEMMTEMVDLMLNDGQDKLVEVYHKYVREAQDVKDISRWAKKVQASEAVLACKGYEKYTKEQLKAKEIRANETNVWDAIKMEELVQQGDRFYVYPAILSETVEKTEKTLKSGKVKVSEKKVYTYGLKQSKSWNGKDQDSEQLLKRLHDTVKIFSTILDMEQFLNYSLARNRENAKNLLTST